MPYPSMQALLYGIQADHIDGGILPVEHATLGPVHGVVNLLETTDLAQSEKFCVSVQHCLLALPGQTIRSLQQVLAETWALEQCALFLRELAVERISMFDAADCARRIWEQQLAQVGVVATTRAAALYHLQGLAEGIQADARNETRYVLLRRGPVMQRSTGALAPASYSPAMSERPMPALASQGALDQTLIARAGNGWHDGRGIGGERGSPGETGFLPTARNGDTALALLEAPQAVPSAAPDLQRSNGQHSRVPAVPAIVLTDVCKAYGKGKHQRWAVDRLTLEVEHGSIFGLLGPNGSGKTTTVNLLCGLLRPSSGSLRVLGFDTRRARDLRQIRQRLGAVPQETALYEELTAHENLAFHAGLYGVPHRQRQRRLEEMLKLAGLFDRRHDRVKTFSGGMKRRLAIARALLHDPELLYLDEPSLGVDVQSRRAIWEYILALREQGKTVLITTNQLDEAQMLCDRVAILDHGRLVALDTPAHLKQRYGASVVELDLAAPFVLLERLEQIDGVLRVCSDPQHTHLTITTEQMNAVLPRLLACLPAPPTSIAVHEPSLDDIFLHLTGAALRD